LQLLKTAIPHFRLGTLTVNEIKQLSKSWLNSEKTLLGNRLLVQKGNSLPRNKAQQSHEKTIVLEFIPKEVIKSDWEMIGQSLIQMKKVVLKVTLGAKQNIFLRGMEVLTRAENDLKILEEVSLSQRLNIF